MVDEMAATETEAPDNVDSIENGSDLNLDLQDRMSDGAESAWYSDSNGTVFDDQGNEVVHPETGERFRSQAEYDKFVAQSNAKNAQAKPQEQAQPQQPKPMSRSFDSIMAGQAGQVDANRLFELAKANDAYKYQNELIPAIDATLQQQPIESEKTPIQLAEEFKQERIKSISEPMVALRNAMCQSLVKEGVNFDNAAKFVNEIADQVYKQHLATIESEFLSKQTDAMAKMAELKAKSVVDPIERKELVNKSTAMIDKLAKSYYGNDGADAFFSLVNGYNDEKGNFQRGAAASVIDLLMSSAAGDKKFRNENERNEFYATQFHKMTADPVKAQALFDVAHNYWLGKNIKNVYANGKQKGLQEAQRVQKHVKPRPAASNVGVSESGDEGLGPMMRAFLGN